jgi:CheY-like chemotaxis protein
MLKVLVVDDEDAFRRAFVNMLMNLSTIDFEPEEADSGEATIRLFEKGTKWYHAVFLDLNLPTVSGLETYDTIKPLTRARKIVLMTSDINGKEAVKARRRGLPVYDKQQLHNDLISILFSA